METPPASPPPSRTQLVVIRFALCYLGLFYVADVFMYLAAVGVRWPERYYLVVAQSVASFSSERVLGLGPIPVWFSGTGDKTYDWALTFALLVIAAVATVVWTGAARRSDNQRLHAALRVWLRFNLFYTMLSFGIGKVFKTQFPMPDVDRLIQPFGLASPSGLLWTMMGYSLPYNIFTGLVEVVGALLLVSKRTTTLGALLLAGAMTNVWMLNMTYDVGVKLYGFHLLISCVILLVPELDRLARVFVWNRPTLPVEQPTLVAARFARAAWTLKAVFVVAAVGWLTLTGVRANQSRGDQSPLPPLYGLYEVTEYSVDGHTIPPLTTELDRWRRIAINRRSILGVQTMNDEVTRFTMRDNGTDVMRVSPWLAPPPVKPEEWHYRHEGGHLMIEGKWNGQDVRALAVRVVNPKFLLLERGFNWTNETAFNK